MNGVPIISPNELIEQIRVVLESLPPPRSYSHFNVAPSPTVPAAYVLILGAGFSFGVVPLVKELMRETIGECYSPDQDHAGQCPASVLRKESARFWADFNEAAEEAGLAIVELDRKGLPENCAAAYQCLFTGEGANVLLAQLELKKPAIGTRFVNGFLRSVLDPGCEVGRGSTGRNRLNPAHIYLAALLEAQQSGRGWTSGAFCRTIITTNFDTLLQNALQMVNLLYRLTDRPEKGLDRSDFLVEEGPIHLVYAHGSILRHNPASTIDELGGLERKNIEVLRDYLRSRHVITIGYGGWNDGLMAALRLRDPSQQELYWCDIGPQPADHVATFLKERSGRAVYVNLGEAGADGFMQALYQALLPVESRRDPMQWLQDWQNLVLNRKGP